MTTPPPIDRDPDPLLPGRIGGVVEIVKRGVIVALRRALTGTSLSTGSNSEVHVDLEYPMQAEQYPGVWVQFSLRRMNNSGIGHVWKDSQGNRVQQWMYDGEVTLTVVALTSMERDRISDVLISFFAFSRPMHGVETGLSPLYEALAENPHLSMTINSDELIPGGQAVTVGLPWDPERLAYEDNYKFALHGEFQSTYSPSTQSVVLSKIQLDFTQEYPDPDGLGQWQ